MPMTSLLLIFLAPIVVSSTATAATTFTSTSTSTRTAIEYDSKGALVQEQARRKKDLTARNITGIVRTPLSSHTNTTTSTTKPATSSILTRVIGGESVKDALDFAPYFAQLPDHACGAAVIHDDFLVSAAHCERVTHPFFKRVLLGSNTINTGIERQIEYVQGHPGYLDTLQDFDFLLIKLTKSALVDSEGNPTGVQSIAINRSPDIPASGDPILVMGFGKTDAYGSGAGQSDIMQQVQIEYIADTTCREQYGADQFYQPLMFCAGVAGGGKDTCQGDSGGPVVDVERNVLAGVVSYGIGCARANYAGVNARISAVADWIDYEICRGSDYPPDNCAIILEQSSLFTTATSSSSSTKTVDQSSTFVSVAIREENKTEVVTSSNSNNNNDYDDVDEIARKDSVLGSVTLRGSVDAYPQEFAWSLSRADTREELFLQMPSYELQSLAEINESINDLLPGTYDLQIGDTGLDGICCGYGAGFLRLVNGLTGAPIWTTDGQYGAYQMVRFELDDSGNTELIEDTTTYVPSWARERIPNQPELYDPEFPGPLPSTAVFSFNINVRFDAFSFEFNYVLYHIDRPIEAYRTGDLPVNNLKKEWTQWWRMEGIADGAPNDIRSTTHPESPPGWYWLHITDTDGDGICCEYRRGWISLTGPIHEKGELGVAWNSDGDFAKGLVVHFFLNEKGYIAEVHSMTTEEADTVATARTAGSLAGKPDGGERRLRSTVDAVVSAQLSRSLRNSQDLCAGDRDESVTRKTMHCDGDAEAE